jgi:hypothetical protein
MQRASTVMRLCAHSGETGDPDAVSYKRFSAENFRQFECIAIFVANI